MIPEPPLVITAHQIAENLFLYEGKPTHEFLKAVQRCLRELRRDGRARSVPHGRGAQLGWLLTARTKSPATTAAAPPPAADTPVPNKEAPVRHGPKLGMQGKVLQHLPREPAGLSVESIAKRIESEHGLGEGEAVKAVGYQLIHLEKNKLAIHGPGGWSRRVS